MISVSLTGVTQALAKTVEHVNSVPAAGEAIHVAVEIVIMAINVNAIVVTPIHAEMVEYVNYA